MGAFFRNLINFTVFLFVLFLMAILSLTNLVFTNAFGETCGILHPMIFQIDVSSIDTQSGAKSIALSDPRIPYVGDDLVLDTYLRVYDMDGQLLDYNDDADSSGTRNSLIENFPLGRYGEVAIEVSTFNDIGTGNYRLSVEAGENVAALASQSFALVVDGQSYRAEQSFSGELAEGERRSYQVSAPQNISIEVIGVEGLDTYLRIYDSNGEIVLENDDYNGYNAGILDFPAQDYASITVEVASYSDAYAGAYELRFVPTLAVVDPYIYDRSSGIVRFNDGGAISIGQNAEGLLRSTERILYHLVGNGSASQSVTIRLNQLKTDGFVRLPSRLFGDSFTALGWASCIEYYGYIGETGFHLNQNGYERYGQGIECDYGSDECLVVSRVKLSLFGQILLYVMTPGLVILLPIAAVYSVRSSRNRQSRWRNFQWIMMLVLVALHVLTTSLLYVQLSTVSNIEALANFAYGILAGAATGSAIAFMDRVLDVFGERSEN